MPAGNDIYITFIVDFGHNRLHRPCEFCPCENQVKPRDNFVIVKDFVDVAAHRSRKVGKDFFDFLLLFDKKGFQFVIKFDNGKRLNKKRLPGRRLIVHKPLHRALELRFNGDNVSVAAHRDDVVLQIFLILALCDVTLQFKFDVFVGAPDFDADLTKRGACVVAHFGVGNYAFVDSFFQRKICEKPERVSFYYVGVDCARQSIFKNP